MDPDPHPEGPADAEDSGTGIGSAVKSGTVESDSVGNEENASGDSHDAVGGLQRANDDPNP
jgi:hypothetical protein